ncbi:MAG TPA: PQQ-binding-like beta-propeller repeat protein, partial [Chitinophagaceae bacterium]|nr:PQQ-binding-like beta-propeller repeat protein [Chitinophagaceae bacterium]
MITYLATRVITFPSKGWIFLSLLFPVLLAGTGCTPGTDHNPDNWDFAGGNEGQTKYSRLEQINKDNVSKLQVAWTYHSGNMAGNVQCNPLIVDGKMYVTTPAQELIAVDAANGKELWRFNPARKAEIFGSANRGIAYWRSGDEERILFTSGGY